MGVHWVGVHHLRRPWRRLQRLQMLRLRLDVKQLGKVGLGVLQRVREVREVRYLQLIWLPLQWVVKGCRGLQTAFGQRPPPLRPCNYLGRRRVRLMKEGWHLHHPGGEDRGVRLMGHRGHKDGLQDQLFLVFAIWLFCFGTKPEKQI